MVLSPLPDFLLRASTMDVRWQTRDSDGASPRQSRFATTHPTQPRVEQQRPTEPAETRTFATGEICVLMIGFAIAGSAMSDASDWRRASTAQVVLGLVVYLALGLSFCGPIMVSWRERLGRRRPIWGVGESLWFAFGLPIQDGVLSTIIARWFGGASGFLRSDNRGLIDCACPSKPPSGSSGPCAPPVKLATCVAPQRIGQSRFCRLAESPCRRNRRSTPQPNPIALCRGSPIPAIF
jgi:hypothetical protein